MMKAIWISIWAEIIKTKGSFILWLSLVGTLANVSIFFLQHALRLEELLPLHSTAGGWTAYIENHYAGISFMMLPLYVIILASLVTFMEHRTQTWVHLYTLPFPPWAYYAGKLLYTLLHFIAAHLLFILGMLLSGALLGLFQEDMGPFTGQHLLLIGELAAQTIISILALLSLQFWISWRFTHFIIPLTIGILGFVGTALLGSEWPYQVFNPYAYPTAFMPRHLGLADLSLWITNVNWQLVSLGLFFWFLGVGWYEVRRRKMGG